jgi:hypothetical protein
MNEKDALKQTIKDTLPIDDFLKPLYNLIENLREQAKKLHAINVAIMTMSDPKVSKRAHDIAITANLNLKKASKEKHDRYMTELLVILENEVKNKFSFLYNQSAVYLYTFLEAAIKDVIITFLSHPNSEEIKEIGALKMSLYDYRRLSEQEKMDYLFEQYEKSISAGLKYGITRFETLLEPFGLSGVNSKDVSTNIYELAQVRNNLLHKNGIVDKQLKDACPWLPFNLRDKLIVTEEMHNKYADSILEYATSLATRI